MPRTLSATARAAVHAQQTGEVFAVLLDIGEGQLGATIRITNAGADLVSGGNTYFWCPFEFILPDDDDAVRTARVRVDNVDRQILAAIRSYAGGDAKLKISARVVLASSPNTVESGPYDFVAGVFNYDASTIEAQLELQDILNQRFPAYSMTPGLFPGVH